MEANHVAMQRVNPAGAKKGNTVRMNEIELENLFNNTGQLRISTTLYSHAEPRVQQIVDILRDVRKCLINNDLRFNPFQLFEIEALLVRDGFSVKASRECIKALGQTFDEFSHISFEDIELLEIKYICQSVVKQFNVDETDGYSAANGSR